MLKPVSASTRSSLLLILPLLASGCSIAVSSDAICDGTHVTRTEHATALYEDGGDRSVITGMLLIKQIDVACGDMMG